MHFVMSLYQGKATGWSRRTMCLYIAATALATTRCAMLPCKAHDVYWPTSLQQLPIAAPCLDKKSSATSISFQESTAAIWCIYALVNVDPKYIRSMTYSTTSDQGYATDAQSGESCKTMLTCLGLPELGLT